ncbi:MAG: hypothetical protein AB1846_03655 [Chloroflexota bacterium]
MTEMTMSFSLVFPDRKTLDVQSSSDSGGTIALVIQGGKFEAISASQSWFWTDEWQAGERKVDEYIEAGKIETFDSMEEFLDTLGD